MIIQAIFRAIEGMGFQAGNILDAGCGTGNFYGCLPENMEGSRLTGVEIDSLTGRIARQLYQKERILIQGFEKADLPDSFYDLMVGNVPFGGYGVADPRYDKYHLHIHDYFLAKGLDKLRPGGVMAVITSSGTMDKENPEVRRYLAQRAELLGAIRLPSNAFKDNAGTEVTTDILFLQKRDRPIETEPDWLYLDTTENGVPVNRYYAQHPEMVLGEMVVGNKLYGRDGTSCQPFPDSDLAELLEAAVSNIHGEYMEFERDEAEGDNGIPADPDVRNYSFAVLDGKLYYRQDSRMYEQSLSKTAENRVRGMVKIRDCVRRLIDLQTQDAPEEEIRAAQQELNRLYDDFVRRYDRITVRANNMAFSSDNSYPLLHSLEILDDEQKFVRKADMFTKRTIRPPVAITHADTAGEALAYSLAEKAHVDMAYMSALTGQDEGTLFSELHGQVYRDFTNPAEGAYEYQAADEFLSGNIRRKIARYASMVENLPEDSPYRQELLYNLSALERVKPKDLTAGEISVRLGATWIPASVIQQFVYETLGTPYDMQDKIWVEFSKETREWHIEGKSLDRRVETTQTYGTKRVTAYRLIENALNLRDIRVYDTRMIDGKEKRILNREETAIAQDRQDLLRAKFVEWLWQDSDRRRDITALYNERFNSIVPRQYDGGHIRFEGMNPEIQPRPYQRNAVARVLYGGNALFAHATGAGKTYTMIASAMEGKRLGLIHKPMFVVPNNIVGDFAADFLRLYPSANVLMATDKDMEKKNRRKFCSRIATGSFDGIIIAHSQFEKIPLSPERQEQQIRRQIDDIVDGIAAAKERNDSRFTIKELEKSKKSLEARLERLTNQARKDDVIDFEQMGIDQIFVDEADLFKNLFLYTKMRNVAGISSSESLRASDLFAKTQYLNELTGYRGVVFATATPVSNSMCEVYTMQRYLQYRTLEEMGLTYFDDWASAFGSTVTKVELAPEGTGFQQKTRFSEFYNLPELISIFREVADVIPKDMLDIPLPTPHIEVVTVEPSDIQKNMVAELAERAEKIRSRQVSQSTDNMLMVTNDGRKLALDQRVVNPLLPDFEGSKVNACVNKVFEFWRQDRDKRLTQTIFCDLSTPQADGSFNVYDDIRAKLIDKGVPPEEVVFIHEAGNEKEKAAVFAKMRTGKVRILLGSTSRMGAGSNMQDKMIAKHDLDVPWRPRDLEQRDGRIERYGNENKDVYLYRYVTKGTFDAYMYQLLEQKQRMISQVLSGKSAARVMTDVDQSTLEYAEIKALATGDPLIMERCTLETEVGKLNMLRNGYLSQKYELEDSVQRRFPEKIETLTQQIAAYEKDIETVKLAPPAADEHISPMQVGGVTYTKKADAGKAILAACKQFEGLGTQPLGSYRNFEMSLSLRFGDYSVTLKNHQTYTVTLGTDVFGNIQRLDNLIDSLPQKLEACRAELQKTAEQLESAKEELKKEFPKEAELKEKSARLAELTLLLKLDKADREILDDEEPDVNDIVQEPRRTDDRER